MIYDIGGHIAEPGPGGTWRLTPKPGTRQAREPRAGIPEVPAVTPGDLVRAIRAAVSQHEPAGGGQWYADDYCIDCDAGEFWDVVLRAVCEQAGAVTEGTDAILQARQAIADGRVPVPDGDLVTQAMWHLATEGVPHRLERLALAGALIAMEIDQMGAREPRVLRDVTLVSWGPDPGYSPPWPGAGMRPAPDPGTGPAGASA